ncbi:LacI family DNA-binding transcriptional regulator [Microbacterium sp. cf046]|uniref:LacI family DNA-binding transcriptional regulator n=1 Tax=Microbacterium sp. cf046 TaxID=1761803 RepID=UPI0020C8E17D|nr:LacI family DNA-binding transcriptional regulator [Microbacterium sp. cf046]
MTIYTVAERAGVSISTVSLAINAPHRVSEETRARVVAAAGALGYRTGSATARVGGGTRVAVAAPFSTYSTYFRRFAGMLVRARETAIELTAHDLDSAASVRAPLLDALPARRGIEGLIVMGVPLGSAAMRASREAALPLVLIDVRRARPVGDDAPVVLVDDEAGGRLVGEHLRERGHSRVIYLGEPQLSRDYISAGMLRMQGLSEHVAITRVTSALDADPTPALLAALSKRDGPTAIVANHDEFASRAWRGLATSGLSVPDDVAIVGFDDGPLADGLGLTTVRQPFEESGRVALDLLLGIAAGTNGPVRRVDLVPSLVVRSST